jgi:hypothetical protein
MTFIQVCMKNHPNHHDCLWRNIARIFLKNFQKNILNLKKKSSYYFIKVHVKILVKNVIFKKIEIHLQVLLLFKNKHYNT